jgi:hypothetical protein
VGQSHADLSQLKGDLEAIKVQMQQLRDEAAKATVSLNAVGKARPSATKGAAPASKSADDLAYEQVTAQRRTAQRQEAVRRANDPLEQQYGQRVAAQRQARVAQTVRPPTEQEQQYRAIVARDRAKQMEETIKRGTTKDTGYLARGVNALGWSPFMPQSMYLSQMMLGEMGMGLSMPFVAAGMGAIGLGAAGLGLNAYATNQARTGQQLVSAAGAPPFVANSYVTPADEAKLLTQREGALHLTGEQGQQAVSALAGGGLSSDKAFGQALDQTAALVNAFGLSVTDAANFVTTMQVDMGKTGDEVTATLASLAKVAAATGIPLTALGQILQQTPNALANLTNPADAGPEAAMLRALGGSTPNAIALGSIVNASGGQALSIAAQMGKTDQQFNAMQGTTAGRAQIADWTVGLVKQSVAQSGGALDQAMLVINGRLGANLDKATINRLNNLPANATPAAVQAAMNPPGAIAPGSAGDFLGQLMVGNPAGAASTTNPWNVKDMAVNAAQVFLTGGVSNIGTSWQVATNSSAMGVQQLQSIAATGSPAAQLFAKHALLSRGVAIDTPAQLAQANAAQAIINGPPLPNPGSINLAPPAAGSTPGGGGSSGGVVRHELAVTVDVRQNGASIGRTPAPLTVAIQNGASSQQYRAYVPASLRGPQYP